MTPVQQSIESRQPRWFYGWNIVAAGFCFDLLGYGVVTVAFGVFFPVMASSLGWSLGLLSGVLLIQAVAVALLSPGAGVIVDRRGPRLMMLAGALCLGLGAASLALVRQPWQFYILFGVVMAIGSVAMGDVVNHSTVSRWFVRMRGRAMATVTLGFSVAGIVLPLPLTLIIGGVGWRAAWVALGAVTLLVGIPAALVMRRRPEDVGLLPDGGPASDAAQPCQPSTIKVAPPTSVRRALATPTFWLLLVGSTAGGLALYGINVHLVSFLVDRGMELTLAAAVVTALYVAQGLAKPLWGFTSERLPVRVCLALCYVGGGVGVLLLLLTRSVLTVAPFIVVYGLTRGAQSLMVSLAWAEYFGPGIQGRVRGVAAPARVISSAGGPILAGVLFDRTGSYTIAFLIFAAMFMLGGGLSLLARPVTAKG